MKRMFNKAIAIIVCVAMLLPIFAGIDFSAFAAITVWDGSVASSFESGSGTEDDPYIIKTAEQLALLAKNVNEGNEYSGKYFSMKEDIILNDTTNWEQWGTYNDNGDLIVPVNRWIPIGINFLSDFRGNFDGNGHTICGLYADQNRNSGLFGYIENNGNPSAIKNITILRSYIKESGGDYESGCGIIGYLDRGCDIINCSNFGTIVGSCNAGGIVGYLKGDCEITNCTNHGIINGQYAGGIVGISYSGKGVNIANCRNFGEVSGAAGSAGGIVGTGYSFSVCDCINRGNICGDYNVGGITSQNAFGTIENCFNSGDIVGVKNFSIVGGIVGDNREGDVKECINTGGIEGYTAGGIIGRSFYGSVINNCFNEGTVIGIESSGGILGEFGDNSYGYLFNTDGPDQYVGSLSCCYNTGTISCASNSRGYTGGVIGSFRIDNRQLAYLTVSDCYNTGSVSGNWSSGGIAGYAWVSTIGAITVRHCYNIGNVSMISRVENCLGGVLGYAGNSVEVDECYYLEGCVEQSNTYGNVLTEECFTKESSFMDWNFQKTWEYRDDPDYLYPTLKHFGSKEYIYEIKLFDNGSLLNQISLVGGSEYILPDLNEKENLDFGYWLADNTRYNAGDTIVLTDDMSLYAVWTTRNTSENVWHGSIDLDWDGEGTAESPYLISSAEELAGLAYQVSVNNEYRLKSYRQTADITLNDGGDLFSESIIGKNIWTPISSFHGQYDGNGHLISGLYTTGYEYSGLFGGVYGSANIQNIHVINSMVIGSKYTGGIVGFSNGKIIDCHFKGLIVGSGGYTGGIVGSSNAGVAECTNEGFVKGYGCVGGVAGEANDITCCINRGEVSGSGCIGGVVGQASDSGGYIITQCINEGNVTNNGAYTGGIIGGNYHCTVSECYNEGHIEGTYITGGLTGLSYGSMTMQDCYNSGIIEGENYTGGFSGYIKSSSSFASCYNTGTISNKDNAGKALVGYVDYSVKLSVSDCYYLQGSGEGEYGIGSSLTSDQMKLKESFENWNFNKTWEIGYHDSSVYPTLRCFGSKESLYELVFYDGEEYYSKVYVKDIESFTFTGLTPKNDLDFSYWMSGNEKYYSGDTIEPTDDMIFHSFRTTRNTSKNVWDGTVDLDWEGEGTEDSPYLISSAEELAGLAQQNKENNDFSRKYYRQTANILLNDRGEVFSEYVGGKNEWIPIRLFYGVYDGNGFTISGLYVKQQIYESGLFAYASGATIQNLSVTKTFIQGSATYAGGIAGTISDNCTIKNCSFSGIVNGNGETGGLVGYMSGYHFSIQNCTNYGTVIGKGSKTGGLIGYSEGSIEISGCVNRGSVVGKDYTGGIIGYASYGSRVADCHNYNAVSGTSEVGGIVGGGSHCDIIKCDNIGDVTGSGNSVGGVVGYSEFLISNSFNTGKIKGNKYVGGIAGSGSGNISSCYNTGVVSGANDCGGILGFVHYTSIRISDCYNTQTISSRSVRSGGILGNTDTGDNSIVEHCYDIGKNFGLWYYYAQVDYSECYSMDYYEYHDSSYGIPLTDDQMRIADSFVGFDFENTWQFNKTEGYDYPTLSGAEHVFTFVVSFVDSDSTVLKEQIVQRGESATPPEIIGSGDGVYYRELDHWDGDYSNVTSDVTVKAVYKQVEIIKFIDITVPFTVENGFSREELRVQLEAYLGRKLCTTTNGFKMRCDIVWNEEDLYSYDPNTSGEYMVRGILKISDPVYSYLGNYYDMAEGAGVKVIVTVLPENTHTDKLTMEELDCELIGEKTVKVTGYRGKATEIVIPEMIMDYRVVAVDDNAFSDCASLTAVYLPASIETIGNNAFDGCTSLYLVSLGEGVKSIGYKAFYNTSLISVTVPEGVTAIGGNAFGYYSDDNGDENTIEGFQVFCYANSAGEAYAEDNGFEKLSLNEQFDEASGVYAIVEENVTLVVDTINDGDYYDTAQQIVQDNDDVALFEIKTVDEDEKEVQPGNVITLSIPVPEGFDAQLCKVYRINSDGSYKEMNTRLLNGKLVFNTPHLSFYAIVEENVELPAAATITPTSVLLEKLSGYEYRCGNGEWQADPLFEGLKPDTEYTFYARIAATDEALPSAESEGVVVRTAQRNQFDLSGTITSNDEPVNGATLVLMKDGECVDTYVATDNSFIFENVENGTYTLSVSAEGHVTRSCDIVIYNQDYVLNIELEKVKVDKMILGDADGDGEVTILDATSIQRWLASLPNNLFKDDLADADGDGEVTILDATAIQRWLASLPTNENIGKPV